MEFKAKEFMNREKLLKEFKEGRRDFSNVDAREIDLSELDLRAIILRNADLSAGSLKGSDLSHADLRGANMKWMNLEHTNFTRANLSKADASYSKANNAIFDEAKVDGADFSYALMFKVNRGAANFGDAMLEKTAWSESDLDEMAKLHVQAEAESLTISQGVMTSIQRSLSKVESMMNRIAGVFGFGKAKEHAAYGREEPSVMKEYGISRPAYAGGHTGYAARETGYTERGGYSARKEKKQVGRLD